MRRFYPNKVIAYRLIDEAKRGHLPETNIKRVWVPARAIGAPSIAERFAMAWDVFTGKADALYWPRQ